MDINNLGVYVGFYSRLIFFVLVSLYCLNKSLKQKNNIWFIFLILNFGIIIFYYELVLDSIILLIPLLFLIFSK
ncbi:MAG: hypothetical protein ACOC3V_01365, partial [bacterium]